MTLEAAGAQEARGSARLREMSDIDSQSGGSSADSAEVVDDKDEDWEWGDDIEQPATTRYEIDSACCTWVGGRLYSRQPGTAGTCLGAGMGFASRTVN